MPFTWEAIRQGSCCRRPCPASEKQTNDNCGNRENLHWPYEQTFVNGMTYNRFSLPQQMQMSLFRLLFHCWTKYISSCHASIHCVPRKRYGTAPVRAVITWGGYCSEIDMLLWARNFTEMIHFQHADSTNWQTWSIPPCQWSRYGVLADNWWIRRLNGCDNITFQPERERLSKSDSVSQIYRYVIWQMEIWKIKNVMKSVNLTVVSSLYKVFRIDYLVPS